MKKNRAEIVFKLVDILMTPLQNLQGYRKVKSVRKIQFDTADSRLKLDVYYKKGTENVEKPVIVYYAGGGFIGGSKNFRKSTLRFFAAQGYAAIGVDYRLSPRHAFPTHVIDCYNGLNFLPEIAERFNLDLSRVIVGGDSSGGYCACYCVGACLRKDVREAIGLAEPKVIPFGFLGWCGAYDAYKLFSAKSPLDVARVTGECFFGMRLDKECSQLLTMDKADYISPIRFIREDWVPSYFCYSEKDIFCKGQGEDLKAKFDEYGIPYRYTYTTQFFGNHDYQLFAFSPYSQKTRRETAEYLRVMAEKGKLD